MKQRQYLLSQSTAFGWIERLSRVLEYVSRFWCKTSFYLMVKCKKACPANNVFVTGKLCKSKSKPRVILNWSIISYIKVSIHKVPPGPEQSIQMTGKYELLSIKVILACVSRLHAKYKMKQLNKS